MATGLPRIALLLLVLDSSCGATPVFAAEPPLHQSTPIGRKALLIDTLVDQDAEWIQKNRFDWRRILGWSPTEFFTDEPAQAVCQAVEVADLATIDRLLADEVDIDQTGKYGMTFLLYSLFLNETSMRHLLQAGANADEPITLDWPEERTSDGLRPGVTATLLIAGCGSAEDLGLLMDQGTDPHHINPYSGIPLVWCVDTPEKLGVLLERGADVNQISADGTPNPALDRYEDPKMILYLLENGFDYFCTNRWGVSVLSAAAHKRDAWLQEDGWREIVHYLENEAKVDLGRIQEVIEQGLGIDGDLAPFVPSEKDRVLKHFSAEREIELIRVIDASDMVSMERLVQSGVDVNCTGKGGVTPLVWATGGSIECFKKLLELGADPNVRLTRAFRTKGHIGLGETVLFWAIRCGTVEHVKLIMRHEGDPNMLKPYTRLPALFEVFHTNDDFRAPNGKEYDRWKSIRAFDAQKKIRLLTHSSRPNEELNCLDIRGRTALMLAHLNRRYELFLPLLIAGADCRQIDRVQHFDIMLYVVHQRRFRWDALRDNDGIVSPKHQTQFAADFGPMMAWIEAAGGDFDLTETMVFGEGGQLKPVIDLRKLTAKDRPWLPPEKREPR